MSLLVGRSWNWRGSCAAGRSGDGDLLCMGVRAHWGTRPPYHSVGDLRHMGNSRSGLLGGLNGQRSGGGGRGVMGGSGGDWGGNKAVACSLDHQLPSIHVFRVTSPLHLGSRIPHMHSLWRCGCIFSTGMPIVFIFP